MITKPVQESNRVRSLDVARGFALLGIFLVNIAFMAAPIGEAVIKAPVPGESTLSQSIYYITKALFEGKTYPLFSMLFGIGLAIQFGRSQESGTSFYPRILRRQFALIAIGLLHVALLWYGDILFLYGIVGMAVLFLVHLRARRLLTIAAGLVLLSVVMGAAMSAFEAFDKEQRAAQRASQSEEGQAESTVVLEADADAPETPLGRLFAGFKDGSIQEPDAPGWVDNEIIAIRDGPFLQAFGFRVVIWISYMIFGMILAGVAIHVAAMFLLGAALWKLDVLAPGKEKLRLKLAVGFGVAGLVSTAYVTLFALLHPNASPYLTGMMPIVNYITGPMLSLFYLFGIACLVDSGLFKPLVSALSNAGRLALTNYLSQTVLASIIFAFWGFGMFNAVDRPMRVVIVLSIFAAQLVFSALWLKAFKIGPLEWFLRSITYLHLPKLRRRAVQSD